MIMLDVTCRTADCSENGITKQADTDGSIPIICGVCGQQITDVKPAGASGGQ